MTRSVAGCLVVSRLRKLDSLFENQSNKAPFRERCADCIPSILTGDEPDRLKRGIISADETRAAAEAAVLSLSRWIRTRLRQAAKKELENVNMPVAFLERLSA